MNKKRIFKWVLSLFVIGLITGGSIFLYYWYMPHRDVQASSTDYKVNVSALVEEYLEDEQKANEKYLDEEGESKIFEISGTVSEIDQVGNSEIIIALNGQDVPVGIRCTLDQGQNADGVKVDDKITIKGVIRSGPVYDELLEMYIDGVMAKSSVINN